MARNPKNSPVAASENAAGYPINMNSTIPANMSGAMLSRMKFIAAASRI